MMISFDEFCGGELWNQTLLLNNSWPEVTPCFQSTILVWVPCGFLWLCSLIYVPYVLSQSRKMKLPYTVLNFVKTSCSGLLIVTSTVRLARYLGEQDEIVGVQALITQHTVEAFTFLLTIVLMQIDRIKGVFTSGLLFLFWTLLLVTSTVPFYTFIIQKVYEHDLVNFYFFNCAYGLIVVQFFLQWISDLPNGDDLMEQNQCPEITASFPSRMVMFWMTRLLMRGFKKNLSERDVWSLNPRDTCNTLVPRFDSEWTKEVKRVKRKNAYLRSRRRVVYVNDDIFEGSKGLRKSHNSETTLLLKSGSNESGSSSYGSAFYVEDFKGYSRENVRTYTPSLFWVFWKLFGLRMFFVCLVRMASDVLTLTGPIVLSALIAVISNVDDKRIWQGYMLAVLLLAIQLVTSLLLQFSVRMATVFGMNLKTVCILSVYKKALMLSNEARKKITSGEITNLMSVDCQRICDATLYMTYLLSLPVQIVISIILIYNIIGYSVFTGVVLLMIILPVNAFLGHKSKLMNRKNMKEKDQRLKMLNEILNGIKVLKLFAWEPSFKDKVEQIRKKEINLLKKIVYYSLSMNTSTVMAPFLVTLITFATYVLIDPINHLDASKVFVTIALFNILRIPMGILPLVITTTGQALVAIKRVNDFFCLPNLDSDTVIHDRLSDYAVKIRKGTFTWDKSVGLTLRNINLSVQKGALVAVVGEVSSGKSSLLSAILGEMDKTSGNVTVQSSIAYVPQQAWIQNATLRDNILFSKKFREKKYKAVIDACELNADLALLSAGDMTEIGDKGINLSGGQKQRVSLARAVYSNSDIYLFDDPLSAVDSHVGKQIFSKVIGSKGLLNGKTRILVTHGVHWLPLVDQIIVMKDGIIAESGCYEELMASESHFAEFLREYLIHIEDDDDEDEEVRKMRSLMREQLESMTSDATSSDDGYLARRRIKRSESITLHKSTEVHPDKKRIQDGRLIEEERLGQGKVKRTVFLTYIRAAGLISFFCVLGLYGSFQAATVLSSFFLAHWTEDPMLQNASFIPVEDIQDTNLSYLSGYSLFGLVMVALSLLYTFLLRMRLVRASARLHESMLNSVFHSPMMFFETTPLGRIVNRMSRDVDTVDVNLPEIIRMTLSMLFSISGTIIVISINTPAFLYAVVPLFLIYLCAQNFYVPTSRQLKRIESVTRSPVYEHFSETITGASSIRAYRAVDRFIDESKRRVDRTHAFLFAGYMANRWLGFFLDTIGAFTTFFAAIFAVASPDSNGSSLGLSVSYALQLSGILSWLVRQISELETNIVSVERIKEYSELPSEAAWTCPYYRPPWNWPRFGQVEMRNYMTRYRPGLDLALKGINCVIAPGQKVGIVGRTGAGKSSFTLALFRILEAAGGRILIDDLDISDIGLHDLRSRLTILPQDPVLFSGTLRMNLDPLGEFEDQELWTALDRAHLKRFVLETPDQLMYDCGEGGVNLSVGQRQLVCLARALLRHTRILVLDEATAAIDMETDALIQKTIRVEFEHCTVISIAHRLNTIMDYDKIIVMDEGQIREYDSPDRLLKNTESMFYGMAKTAGLV